MNSSIVSKPSIFVTHGVERNSIKECNGSGRLTCKDVFNHPMVKSFQIDQVFDMNRLTHYLKSYLDDNIGVRLSEVTVKRGHNSIELAVSNFLYCKVSFSNGTLKEGVFDTHFDKEPKGKFLKKGISIEKGSVISDGVFDYDKERGRFFLAEGSLKFMAEGECVLEAVGTYTFMPELNDYNLTVGRLVMVDGTVFEGVWKPNLETSSFELAEGLIYCHDGITICVYGEENHHILTEEPMSITYSNRVNPQGCWDVCIG